MNKFSKIVSFALIFLPFLSIAQFLEDEKARESTLKGLDLIYNFEFEKSDQFLGPIKTQYANHPVVHLLNALKLQNQYIPIDGNPAAYKSYINELKKCEERAKVIYKNPKFKTEATYFLLASEGLLALSNVYRKEYLEMGIIANRAYGIFLESQKIKSQSSEFLFSSGLYNYYRVEYPESHPATKSIFYFFEKGNKKLGIQELELSAKNSIFSRIEAQTFLIHILIKYESNFKKAHQYANNLYSKYPNNSLFLVSQIESLLYIKEYEKAASLNILLSKKTDAVSKISNLTFEGYLDEHFKNDLASAKSNYAKAIKIPRDDRHTKDYHAMAYLGLGNILKKENSDAKAKAMYKESIKIAEYKWIIETAKTELKTLK
jgi:hypothetical protein